MAERRSDTIILMGQFSQGYSSQATVTSASSPAGQIDDEQRLTLADIDFLFRINAGLVILDTMVQ